MIYLNVLGQHFVILSSLGVITDLFEKRSSNYSDRKHVTMLSELYVSHSFHLRKFLNDSDGCRMGVSSLNMAFMPYGPLWRQHRRSFHEHFHRDVVTKYQPIQKEEVRAFLRLLLVTPDNFFHHIRQ